MERKIFQRIRKELPGIKKGVSLKEYTTFKIGGPAQYFLEVKTKQGLIEAIKKARNCGVPFFILGGGSNILVSDEGYKGLIIRIKNQESRIKNISQRSKIIEAEAGLLLSQLVNIAFKNGLTGLEWGAGIPGTVGGAIRGNAGAFGSSMADILKTVEVLDTEEMKVRNFKNKECKFGYRDSIFKSKKNLIILSAILQLKKGEKQEIGKKIQEYLEYRRRIQPLSFFSTGCIFKNPAPEQSSVRGKPFRFFAGELIEKCGLKGKKIGRAQISERHANFIINAGGAKSRDVIELISLAKKKVKEKFGIELEEEIQYLGF